VHKSLEQVYSTQVKGKNSVHLMPSSGPSFSPSFEKDPQNQQLENNLINSFNNILKEEERINPTIEPVKPIGLKTFSFEDALIELHQMSKNSNNL
jgi:hypothetical protein